MCSFLRSFYRQLGTLIVYCILLCKGQLCFSQNDFVIISDITYKGNHKTHSHILAFEMDLNRNDTIPLSSLAKKVAEDEERLSSMGLFTSVKINVIDWHGDTARLDVVVVENLFIYPYIIFELADRNFNVWKKEFNYSIKRTNYGLAMTHINFTGHKDKLKVKFQRGYTHKYELFYEFPYIYKGWGLASNFLYSENKEFGYVSNNNKLLFYKDRDEKVVLSQYRGSLTLTHRTSAYLTQQFRSEYIKAKIIDTVATTLNPGFLGKSRTTLPFWHFHYNLVWNRTLYPLYPQGGYRLELNLRKDGYNRNAAVNNAWASLDIEYHQPISKRWILSSRIKGKYYLLNNGIPYIIYGALGYGNDGLTGYQLKVMDGDHFFINKNALKFRIIDRDISPKLKWTPKQFKKMNIKLFLRGSFDYGYVSDPQYRAINPLSNSHEYGYGPGFDAVIYNNLSVSIDYSWIRNGENGLFINSGFNF